MFVRSTNVRFLPDLGYLAAMNALFTAKSWFEHCWHGKLPRSLHSPYLFRLFQACIPMPNALRAFQAIEHQRNLLLSRGDFIERVDYGAGSIAAGNSNRQSIRNIARHALSLRGQCQFMGMLAQYQKPVHILELGTSLGILSAYLKTGCPSATVTTVEGDPAIAAIAKTIWTSLQLKINGITSTFELFFETQEFQQTTYDLVFIDGNHRSSAVIAYVKNILPHLHPNAVVLVDDIYWSKDMLQGWEALQELPEVTQSVDCFRFGMLFFRPDFLAKEHHRIILL